jgi:hypothetical protein
LIGWTGDPSHDAGQFRPASREIDHMKTIAIGIMAGTAISTAALLSTTGAAIVVGAVVGVLTLMHYASKEQA